jgi:hypothetical protein
MAEFLVEFYAPKGSGDAVEAGAMRARLAAEELRQAGTHVSFVRSIFVPEDETCFYLFEAATLDVVRVAARRAGLPFDRITGTVTVP